MKEGIPNTEGVVDIGDTKEFFAQAGIEEGIMTPERMEKIETIVDAWANAVPVNQEA